MSKPDDATEKLVAAMKRDGQRRRTGRLASRKTPLRRQQIGKGTPFPVKERKP